MKQDSLKKPSDDLTRMLAANVRGFRHAKRLSQEELAERCGLHRTYIGSVERGERNVTLSTLETLALALDVSIIELISKRDLDDEV
jgi:transcriptional regulator with XRE-family HTH domain